MEELKPCPFCGASAQIRQIDSKYNPASLYQVECTECWAETDLVYKEELDDRISQWNRRVTNDSIPGMLDDAG